MVTGANGLLGAVLASALALPEFDREDALADLDLRWLQLSEVLEA